MRSFNLGSTAQFDKSDLRAILRQNKAWKRRNTLCISSFHNAVLEQKGRKAPQAILCGGAF
jgi:hypothetical protein